MVGQKAVSKEMKRERSLGHKKEGRKDMREEEKTQGKKEQRRYGKRNGELRKITRKYV